ncbi:MAG: hypothetical protein N2B06_02200, partial [Clostridium sp.]
VKLQCANGTARVTLWESRLSLGNKETAKFRLSGFFLRKNKLTVVIKLVKKMTPVHNTEIFRFSA